MRRRGVARAEAQPGLTELYPIASLVVAALISVWLVSRTLLFLQMHDTAHSQHFNDLGLLRRHTSRPAVAVVKQNDAAPSGVAAPSTLRMMPGGGSTLAAGGGGEKELSSLCHMKENIEYGGDLVLSGTENLKNSPAECCASCQAFIPKAGGKPCNTWVYQPKQRACWLKNSPNPTSPPITVLGDAVEWVSGSLFTLGEKFTGVGTIHTVLTSNGNPYMNWQTRIMYATYLAVTRADPGGPMKAFTRVLHRHTDDELMQEVPTWRTDPVHINCDEYCSFPVADRSPALVQWMKTDDAQRCTHIMLVETDHLFVKAIRPDVIPKEGFALAFPFGYIVPTFPTIQHILQKFYKGSVADVPPTGNAPVLMTVQDFRKIIPDWAEVVLKIEDDPDAVDKLGWVRDMYAWSFSAARVGLRHIMPQPPFNPLMVQPPADRELGDAAILHYTWGPIVYNSSNAVVWEFDKRTYGGGQYAPGPRKLEKIPLPPAWEKGMHLQAFFSETNAVTREGLELMRLLATTFNAAVDSLNAKGELPAGWTDREAAAKAALPSAEAKELADKVQREIAEAEERKKKQMTGGSRR